MSTSPEDVRFEPSIAMSLLRPFARLTAQLPSEFAARLGGLPANDDDEGRMPLREFVAWLEEASILLHEPAIGLRALAYLERGIGGVVEFGAATAPTLVDALSFLSSHARVLNEAADFWLCLDGEHASFELRSRMVLPRALRDFQLGAILFALRTWLGDSSDWQVRCSYREPADCALHRSLFAPSQVHFDASCDAIVFKVQRLSQPLVSADAVLHRVLRRHAEQIEHTLGDHGNTLVRRVREELFDLLPRGGGGVVEVSSRFGLTPRTLGRRLAREGVNFRQLLDEVRQQRALRYLESTNLGVSRVARLLGYSDATSFCRAFTRWRGETPLSYRRAGRSERPPASARVTQSPAQSLAQRSN